MVRSSAESLLTIINDILDFSKIEAGKLDLVPTELSLRDAIAEVMKLLALRAREKGLDLLFEVDSSVPDLLQGDPDRLRQILMNLIGNAISSRLGDRSSWPSGASRACATKRSSGSR